MDAQDKYNAPLARNLRTLIDERKTSITAVAAAIGITRQAVSQYCDGTGQPNAAKLTMIAKFFDVSVDFLLGLTETHTADERNRIAGEVTGLTDKAVKVLSDLRYANEQYFPAGLGVHAKERTEPHSGIISSIIESDDFIYMLNEIGYYLILSSAQSTRTEPPLTGDEYERMHKWADAYGVEIIRRDEVCNMHLQAAGDKLKFICEQIKKERQNAINQAKDQQERPSIL